MAKAGEARGEGAECISRQGAFGRRPHAGKIYGEMGASTVWRSGLRRRQGLALWAWGDPVVEGIGGALRVEGGKGICHGAVLAGGDNGWHRRKRETTAGIMGASELKEAKLSPDFQ